MVSQLIETWNSIYANHAMLRTGIGFVHIAGLVAGGGCAITADLATIVAAREPSTSPTELRLLKHTHSIVLWGLVALVLSGGLLLAADIQTYLYSKVFWLKMGFMLLLIVNGALFLVGERRARRGDPLAWKRLHTGAVASLLLWSLTTLAGVALQNVG